MVSMETERKLFRLVFLPLIFRLVPGRPSGDVEEGTAMKNKDKKIQEACLWEHLRGGSALTNIIRNQLLPPVCTVVLLDDPAQRNVLIRARNVSEVLPRLGAPNMKSPK